jgi:hypothetical protein
MVFVEIAVGTIQHSHAVRQHPKNSTWDFGRLLVQTREELMCPLLVARFLIPVG